MSDIDDQGGLHIPVGLVLEPCEDCGKTPALQWAIPGIGSGVLCRSCLNAVIEQINAALAAMAQEESERASAKPPIICSQCGKPLLPATTFDYQGVIYCPNCLPKYDKHEQF